MDIGEIALYMMYIRDQIKIYHWQTKSYARHKASDSLVNNLSSKLDKFVEVIQGSRLKRIIIPKSFNKFVFDNQTDNSALKLLLELKKWLESTLPKYLEKTDTELLNIRDDILADVQQTIYLFTFN